MISNTTVRLFIVYSYTFLQKNVFFSSCKNLTCICGPFSCLINVLFGPIFMDFFPPNAHLILELMLCNRNLTKLDILTLVSSDCRAWALKPTWRYCFCLFHSHDPKPKRNYQIASSRAKTKSSWSQACVKYRDIIICIKRNTDVITSDQKILHKKCLNKVDFSDIIFNFSKLSCGLPPTYCFTEELWP